MCWISIDVEADGPIPGDYSMVAIGAVIVEPELSRTFYGKLHPISGKYLETALKICGFTREETLQFDKPEKVMVQFRNWLSSEGGKNLFFVSDNCFDWQYVNWYFHHYLNENPFGFSSTNLVSLYCGMVRNVYSKYHHHKKPKIHNPLQDAYENASALLKMKETYGLKINW